MRICDIKKAGPCGPARSSIVTNYLPLTAAVTGTLVIMMLPFAPVCRAIGAATTAPLAFCVTLTVEALDAPVETAALRVAGARPVATTVGSVLLVVPVAWGAGVLFISAL